MVEAAAYRRRILTEASILVAAAVGAFGVGWFLSYPYAKIDARSPSAQSHAPSQDSISIRPPESETETDWTEFFASVRKMTTENCIAALDGEVSRDEVAHLRLLELARRDPVAAFDQVRNDEGLRWDVLLAAAETKPEEALKLVVKLVKSGDATYLYEFFGRWASHDLGATRRAIKDPFWSNFLNSDLGSLSDLAHRVGGYWPKDDPAGWICWLAELGVKNRNDFGTFSGYIALAGPELSGIRSLAAFKAMQPGLQRDLALATACAYMPTDAAMSALELELVSDENRVLVAASIANGMKDPAEAIRWFAEQAPQDLPVEKSVFKANADLPIHRWLEAPVPKGIEQLSEWPEWLQQLVIDADSGELGVEIALAVAPPESIATKVLEWVSNDRKNVEAVSQWVGAIDAGDPGRDGAITGLIRGVANDDPGGAYAWAKSISDPDIRERQLRVTISLLAERNADAARMALQDAIDEGVLSDIGSDALESEIARRSKGVQE